MGRRTLLSGTRHNIRPTFEIKLRLPGDRIDSRGNKVEGGRIISIHRDANNQKHAWSRAQAYAKKNNMKVISVAIVHPDEMIGSYKDWKLEKIMGIPIGGDKDAIVGNYTLDDIVFGYRKSVK